MEKAVITRAEIVSFGCLKRVLVKPNDGVNLLVMPNESGKTTFASFVKFVLYGFSGVRMSGVADNEKKRFMPWDGSAAEGTLEIRLGDRQFRITRVSTGQSRDKVAFCVLPSGDRMPDAASAGEVIFGVGEELFTHTAFFRELQLPQGSDPILASELKNISVCSAEKEQAERAVKKLTEAKNELANRQKHGIYYDVKARLDDAVRKYESALAGAGELSRADEKIKGFERIISDDDAALARLSDEMRSIESFEAHTSLLRLSEFDGAEAKAKAEYDEAVKGFDFASAGDDLFKDLSEKYNAYVSVRAESSVCERRLAACEMSISEKQKEMPLDGKKMAVAKKSLLLSRVCGVLIALAAVFGVLAVVLSKPIIFAAAAAAAMAAFMTFASSVGKSKKLGFKSISELKKAVSDYPVRKSELDGLYRTREEIKLACDEWKRKADNAASEIEKGIAMCCRPDPTMSLSQQIENMRYAFAKAQSLKNTYLAAADARRKAYSGVDVAQLKELASAYNGRMPLRGRKTVENETTFYRQQKEQITSKLSELNQSRAVLLSTTGDAALLKGKADALEARLEKIERRGKALSIALETLGDAGEYIRASVAPLINERAAMYFSALTNGKYTSLDVGSELKLSACDGFSVRDCDALSAGARECAYISLRLALTDVMYPDAAVPVFLDDAFVHLDDDRLVSMMNLLASFGKNHQIFIISCSSRDMSALDKSECEYTRMELRQC